MTKNDLLDALSAFTKQTVSGLVLPVQMQKEDKIPPRPREPDVYKMGLADYTSAKKKAPYILHQIVTGKDTQAAGQITASSASVRTVFAVYHEDGGEGPLSLLSLIERFRVELLKKCMVGSFTLDKEAGVEYLIYPDNIPPFYAGEMYTTWILPPVEREVKRWP